MASAFDVDRKKLGLLGSSPKSSSKSAFDADRVKLGLIQEPEQDKKSLPTSLVLEDTLKSVMKPTTKTVNFKAEQAKKKEAAKPAASSIRITPQETVQSKLPAGQLIQTNEGIQQTLQGKVPAASLLQQTGRGPENASQIPGISQYEINKKEIESAPPVIKQYAQAMNYLTEGNPIGIAIGNAFSGNSGATRKDSSGNKLVDKAADVVNDLVTPFITPTGAPVGQGIIGSTYDATAKALSGKVGQRVLGAAEKIIPGSQNVVRVAATEGIAGGLQGAEFGLMQGQDSGREIARNALLGVAAGGVLGGAGAAAGEVLGKVFSKVPKSTEAVVKNSPYEGLTREQRIYRQYLDDVPTSQEDMDFMLGPNWNEDNLIIKPKAAEEVMPKAAEPMKPSETQPLTREQEIYNKAVRKEDLTPEEMDFVVSKEWNNDNLLPESRPVNSVADEVAITTEQPIAEVKPVKPTTTRKPEGERGFYHTLKNSGKADEAVARMDPKYEPISNETSLAGANERVKDLGKSTSDVLSRKLTTAEDGATALRLVQEYTKMGDHETAALISGKAAEDFTQAGQLIQAASMWNRLSPEGMLLRVQREISKVNEVLGASEEKLSLSAADAAKITQTGEKIQGAQKVRDLSQEVLEMVSNKKPGESLTADEQKLLVEFENQVKSVNKSVKPFLKTAKQDAEKIAKIKPENRTRDQVVQYLDQKAMEAQARIAKRRNIGIVAEINNPVIDYSIIAAAKIARGVRTFSDLTEDMIKTVGSEYKQYADEVFTKATQRFRKENGLPTTTELERVIKNASKEFDEASKNALRRMAAEIGYFTDENLKRELTQDLQQVIKTYGRSTLGEKIAGVQTAGQLLSVPTFLRNTLGNAGQFGLEKINKVSAVPIDWTLSKFTGNRTIQFIPMNQEKLWKNFASGTTSGWREVNAMGTLDSYNVKPSVFSDKNPLKYLTKLTGASLQGMDYAAYKAAYGDVMATYAEQLGRAQGMTRKQIKESMPELLTKLDDTVRALADQAGLYATYQDETLLSRAAQGTKKALNAVSDKVSKAAVEKGLIPRSLSLEGFGLGDIVLKYAKTPANLVMRGIDYSPLGFMRAIGEFAPLLKNGGRDFNQFNATRALSRAITGSVGLTAVGYALADAGLLTGASSADADKRSIEEQSGQGAYKANLTGIYRWIMSGFDKKEAKYQKGDQMIDYAWLQPAAITLGMGVNFRNAQDAKKPGEELSNVELAKRSIIGGLRTVLENPMVTGLSDVVGGVSDLINRQDAKKLTGIVKGIPSSFVPAVVGQARNATDNKQRVTYDKSVLKEMLNLVKNRVPGLSKQLPVSYDSLGNARQRIQGGKENTIGQYLNSFLNPTKFTQFNVTPEAKTVLDILNDSNDKDVLPRVIQKFVKFTNADGRQETYKLTKEEYSQLQQKTGQRVIEELQYEQDYLSDNSIDIVDRADVLKQILQDVGTEVRDEFKEAKGLNSRD